MAGRVYRSRVSLSLSQAEARGLIAAASEVEAAPVHLGETVGEPTVAAFLRAFDKIRRAYWAAVERDRAKGRVPVTRGEGEES